MLSIDDILQRSPFLRDAAARDSGNPETLCTENAESLMTSLRRMRRQVMLQTALEDFSGRIALTEVCQRLSDFADAAMSATIDLQVRRETAVGRLQDPHAHGLFVLAMGKWGAGELNYSSDIDLIFFFDPERARDTDAQRRAALITVREMIRLLGERTAEGPAFRLDLRLRPDPASVQAAVSTDFAERYYRQYGRTWERCAFLKARPVAGDRAAAAAFLQRMQSFVHRESVDFSTVDDVADIKRRIRLKHGSDRPRGHDYDVKLGAGGIRDIELHVQTLQLLRGGRDPVVRVPDTLSACRVLSERGYLARDTAAVFADSYDLLRRVEHAAQLVNDEQTHRLPPEGPACDDVLALAGVGAAEVRGALLRVMRHDRRLFPVGGRGVEAVPAGFGDPETVRRILRGWHTGGLRSVVSESDRRRLSEMTPFLLQSTARLPQPDVTFHRLDRLLQKLPGLHALQMACESGVPVRPADILSVAPRIADRAAALVSLPELLLYDDGDVEVSPREASVRIVLRMLSGRYDVDDAAAAFTASAERTVCAALPEGVCAVGMGSLGIGEMHAESDLDLMLLTAEAPREEQLRAVRRMAAGLTASEADGPLYALDLRLRPDGGDGVPITGFAAFAEYHRTRAQTWEKLALLQARPLSSSDPETAVLLSKALRHRASAPTLQAEAAAMREKIATHRPPVDAFDVKLLPGGRTDLAFLIGTRALVCDVLPDFSAPLPAGGRTRELLTRLTAAGAFTADEGALLHDALNLFRACTQARSAFADLRHPGAQRLTEAALPAGRRSLSLADALGASCADVLEVMHSDRGGA